MTILGKACPYHQVIHLLVFHELHKNVLVVTRAAWALIAGRTQVEPLEVIMVVISISIVCSSILFVGFSMKSAILV